MNFEYSSWNYRRNLELYWRQLYPNWEIPAGYHVHHIKPKCTFEDKANTRINHPSNLIALHPDDHASIHKCRGDKHISTQFIISVVGRVMSAESKDKISKARLGLPSPLKGRKGKVPSTTTREIWARQRTGRKHTSDTKNKMSETRTGVKKSKEHIYNMSKSRLGKVASVESKARMSAAKIGKKFYNNGTVTKSFYPTSVPVEFIPGRLKLEIAENDR